MSCIGKKFTKREKWWILMGIGFYFLVALLGIFFGPIYYPSDWGCVFWSVVWPAALGTVLFIVLLGVLEHKNNR